MYIAGSINNIDTSRMVNFYKNWQERTQELKGEKDHLQSYNISKEYELFSDSNKPQQTEKKIKLALKARQHHLIGSKLLQNLHAQKSDMVSVRSRCYFAVLTVTTLKAPGDIGPSPI